MLLATHRIWKHLVTAKCLFGGSKGTEFMWQCPLLLKARVNVRCHCGLAQPLYNQESWKEVWCIFKKGTVIYRTYLVYISSASHPHPFTENVSSHLIRVTSEMRCPLNLKIGSWFNNCKLKNVLEKADAGQECSCIFSIALLCFQYIPNHSWVSGH